MFSIILTIADWILLWLLAAAGSAFLYSLAQAWWAGRFTGGGVFCVWRFSVGYAADSDMEEPLPGKAYEVEIDTTDYTTPVTATEVDECRANGYRRTPPCTNT